MSPIITLNPTDIVKLRLWLSPPSHFAVHKTTTIPTTPQQSLGNPRQRSLSVGFRVGCHIFLFLQMDIF